MFKKIDKFVFYTLLCSRVVVLIVFAIAINSGNIKNIEEYEVFVSGFFIFILFIRFLVDGNYKLLYYLGFVFLNLISGGFFKILVAYFSYSLVSAMLMFIIEGIISSFLTAYLYEFFKQKSYAKNKEEEELENICLKLGVEILMIAGDENISLGQKINKMEEYDKIVLEKFKNSNLSSELKKRLIEISPKYIDKMKDMGYAHIYIFGAFKTLDLSYVDFVEKTFEKIGNNSGNKKIKILSKKCCSILRKAIIDLRDDRLTEELYREFLKKEEELYSEILKIEKH